MEVFGNSIPPTYKQIVYWYLKKYTLFILLTVSIIMFFDFGGSLYLKLMCIFLLFFYPLTFPRGMKRLIYKITFDDDSKKLILEYFILWKKRRFVPYNELHVESIIRFKTKKKQEEMIISIWRRDFVLGEIVFPSEYGLWDKKQIIDISKKFNTIKKDNQTHKPNINLSQEELGKINSFIRVDFFD